MAWSKSKRWVFVSVIVVAAAAGWFFISPFFIDRTVDEELTFTPESTGDRMPTPSEFAASTPEERKKLMEKVTAEMASKPDQKADEAMPPMEKPRVLRRGNFRDGDSIHKGSGDALLYRLPDGSHLVRFEHFRVTNGPALVVYLAKHPDPAKASDVTAGFLELGKLKGNVGNQNYTIPSDVNLSEFHSVVIWCKLFGVLFSPAALS